MIKGLFIGLCLNSAEADKSNLSSNRARPPSHSSSLDNTFTVPISAEITSHPTTVTNQVLLGFLHVSVESGAREVRGVQITKCWFTEQLASGLRAATTIQGAGLDFDWRVCPHIH